MDPPPNPGVQTLYMEPPLGMTLNFAPVPLEAGWAYWPTTAHPFFRLPVFAMGVCAGVLCVRLQGRYSVLS